MREQHILKWIKIRCMSLIFNRIHDSKNTRKDLKLSSVLTTFSQTEVIIILVAPIHRFPTPHDACANGCKLR